MFDAARDVDTILIDEEQPSLSRVRTNGELTMHAMVLGQWHRRTPDLASTACGVPFHSSFCPVRREELTHPLCSECFTKFELAKADAKTAHERNQGDEP